MNTDRFYPAPFYDANLGKLVPNTLNNNDRYSQVLAKEYKVDADLTRQMNIGTYSPDRNYTNLYEYQNGHRFYDMKAMTPLNTASRPYIANLDEIYSRNDVVSQTLNKMVNISGQMIRNADLPISQPLTSA